MEKQMSRKYAEKIGKTNVTKIGKMNFCMSRQNKCHENRQQLCTKCVTTKISHMFVTFVFPWHATNIFSSHLLFHDQNRFSYFRDICFSTTTIFLPIFVTFVCPRHAHFFLFSWHMFFNDMPIFSLFSWHLFFHDMQFFNMFVTLCFSMTKQNSLFSWHLFFHDIKNCVPQFFTYFRDICFSTTYFFHLSWHCLSTTHDIRF